MYTYKGYFLIRQVYDIAFGGSFLSNVPGRFYTSKKKRGREQKFSPSFTPETIRTSDLLLRRQLLYPAELPEHTTMCILCK